MQQINEWNWQKQQQISNNISTAVLNYDDNDNAQRNKK